LSRCRCWRNRTIGAAAAFERSFAAIDLVRSNGREACLPDGRLIPNGRVYRRDDPDEVAVPEIFEAI
jgi:hypothetical protein